VRASLHILGLALFLPRVSRLGGPAGCGRMVASVNEASAGCRLWAVTGEGEVVLELLVLSVAVIVGCVLVSVAVFFQYVLEDVDAWMRRRKRRKRMEGERLKFRRELEQRANLWRGM
jgi:hypothetical protein